MSSIFRIIVWGNNQRVCLCMCDGQIRSERRGWEDTQGESSPVSVGCVALIRCGLCISWGLVLEPEFRSAFPWGICLSLHGANFWGLHDQKSDHSSPQLDRGAGSGEDPQTPQACLKIWAVCREDRHAQVLLQWERGTRTETGTEKEGEEGGGGGGGDLNCFRGE